MKRHHPLSVAGLRIPRSSLAVAALFGLAAQPGRGEVLVDLDATQLSEGPLSTWQNKGTLTGDFTLVGTAPNVVKVAETKGVDLTGAGSYLGPAAPVGITDAGARTIEAWVFNPSGQDFETIVAWGRRGGPDNSNSAFSHGVQPTWGAFGGWGAADLDWQGKLAFGRWNHVVYTYDGTTSSAYADGDLANSEDVTLVTWAVSDDASGATPLPIRVGAANNADGTIFTGEPPSLTVAKIRVHNTALTAADIKAKFLAERQSFFPDADNDGLPNSYEALYPAFLNPNDPTDAAKDQDGDGLTNLQEFQAKTAPDNADTDGDGASDGAELNRKVAGVAAPTDPLKADSDGDGLNDGAEVTAGSDPLLADTDGDGFSDAQEVLHGSNPNSAASTPTITKPIVNLDATSQPEGPLASWTNTGLLGGVFEGATAATVAPIQGVKGVRLNGSTDYYTGPSAPIWITGNGASTIEAWIFNPAVAAEETLFSWGRRGGPDGSNASFNHGSDGTFGAVGRWGSPDIGWAGGAVAGQWTYVVYSWDASSLTTTVYKDGVEANNETLAGPLNVWATDTAGQPLPLRLGSQNDASGVPTAGLRGSMTVARLRVHDRVLDPAAILAQYNAELGDFGNASGDADGDGLPNGYERQFPEILNPNDPTDAAKDPDGDGLSSLVEFQKGTLPNNSDTDGDGLKDGAELNRTAGGAPAPTNPLVADTDQDGLADGAETTTDPLNPDSDGDTYPDGQEVAHGSNPASAASVPDLTKPATIVDLKAADLAAGPLSVWPNSGALGGKFTADEAVAEVTLVNGVKGLALDGTEAYTGPISPVFLTGDTPRTIDAWIYNPVAADEETIFSWGRRGGGDGSNCSFNHGLNGTFGAVGHWGAPDVGWSGQVVVGQWTHVAYTYDPNTTTAVVYSNGQAATTKTLASALDTHATNDNADSPAPLPFRLASQTDANGQATSGLRGSLSIARLRVYDGTLDAAAIAKIYSDEQAAYTTVPLAFLPPVYDPATDKLTLKWTGVSGTTYTLEGSAALAPWQPVSVTVSGDTYVVENVSAKPGQYYRVRTQ